MAPGAPLPRRRRDHIEGRSHPRTFWTLSAWSDADSINAYARTDPHASAIVRARPVVKESTFVFWSAPVGELPIDWAQAQRRIAEKRESTSGQRHRGSTAVGRPS